MATWANLIFFHLFLLLCLFLRSCSELVVSHSVVESLPGFPGPLPFELETGYIGVGESEDVQLFYYFVKSESNPKEDPLLLWLTGGPGCSSFSAFAYELGPLSFKPMQEDEGIPTLILNPFSWSKVASIIFLDLPVGTGFSYGRTSYAFQSTDLQACDQTYQFMRKWLAADHPEFLSNPFYVGGDSYSGITVPIIVQLISNGNEAGIDPLINLKGYILGNPSTNHVKERNYDIPFAHGMGLISDELYESLQISCQGDYFNPKNAQCSQDIQAYYKCTLGIQLVHILEPVCHSSSPRQHEFFDKGRSLTERNVELDVPEPASPCAHNRDAQYLISARWLNYDTVREALHIQKGSIGEWIRCNHRLSYMTTTWSSYQYHVNLSSKGYRSLIYSGDHDLVVPFLGTQAWIRSLNYSIVDDWRSWIAEGQVAGYTRTYSNRMTFATVKGAGHVAPEYKPLECAAMFERWISHQPL